MTRYHQGRRASGQALRSAAELPGCGSREEWVEDKGAVAEVHDPGVPHRAHAWRHHSGVDAVSDLFETGSSYSPRSLSSSATRRLGATMR
jgi:hypothetical protein